MHAIPERLRGVITTRRYANPPLPYLTLPVQITMAVANTPPKAIQETFGCCWQISLFVIFKIRQNVRNSNAQLLRDKGSEKSTHVGHTATTVNSVQYE